VVDPANPSILYAATESGMFKSQDAGTTWQSINTGLTGAAIEALTVDPTNTKVMYTGSNCGVFQKY